MCHNEDQMCATAHWDNFFLVAWLQRCCGTFWWSQLQIIMNLFQCLEISYNQHTCILICPSRFVWFNDTINHTVPLFEHIWLHLIITWRGIVDALYVSEGKKFTKESTAQCTDLTRPFCNVCLPQIVNNCMGHHCSSWYASFSDNFTQLFYSKQETVSETEEEGPHLKGQNPARGWNSIYCINAVLIFINKIIHESQMLLFKDNSVDLPWNKLWQLEAMSVILSRTSSQQTVTDKSFGRIGPEKVWLNANIGPIEWTEWSPVNTMAINNDVCLLVILL